MKKGNTKTLENAYYPMKMMRILCSHWLLEHLRNCPLCFQKSEFFGLSFGQMINPLLTKLVQSRWLDFGVVLFLIFFFMDFDFRLRPYKRKNRTWPISSYLYFTLGLQRIYLARCHNHGQSTTSSSKSENRS